jgi:hypothetical protein
MAHNPKVLVVGGGPSRPATAALLMRQRMDVLLVDWSPVCDHGRAYGLTGMVGLLNRPPIRDRRMVAAANWIMSSGRANRSGCHCLGVQHNPGQRPER